MHCLPVLNIGILVCSKLALCSAYASGRKANFSSVGDTNKPGKVRGWPMEKRAIKSFNIQHVQHYGLEKELLLLLGNMWNVLHGNNMQEATLPAGLHLEAKTYL